MNAQSVSPPLVDSAQKTARATPVSGLPNPSGVRFVPPPLPSPAPVMDVRARTQCHFSTHRIEVLLGSPSTLPDIPPPPAAVENRIDRIARPAKPRYLVKLAITVYDRKTSHLKWQHPLTKDSFEVWWSCDASLINPFPIVDPSDTDLMLGSVTRMIDTTLPTRFGKSVILPVFPELGENEYRFVHGDPTLPGGDEVMQSLSNYYLKHETALRELQIAREAYQADARAWFMANPPKPQNHTIWLKPHRGSRYLSEAKPEGTR